MLVKGFFGMVVRAGSGQKFGKADRWNGYSVVSSSPLSKLVTFVHELCVILREKEIGGHRSKQL
jgi:hypothetical protein